jgi:hypothetical protein
MHADLEEGVADRHRDIALGGEPADPHQVGDLTVNVQDVGGAGFEQPALAVGIEIFAGIDQRPGTGPAQQPQPVDVPAVDGSLRGPIATPKSNG